MNKTDKHIEMKVHGLANSQVHSGAFALILAEVNGVRRIPIVVGIPEAQSIAVAIENIHTLRPLTHDLVTTILNTYHVKMSGIYIYKFEDGIYYTHIILENDEREVTIDCRPSDAIALAIRAKCPIFINSDILDECGVEVWNNKPDETSNDVDSSDSNEETPAEGDQLLRKWLKHASTQDIEKKMQQAIEEENYEYAKLFTEELKHRQDTNQDNTPC